MQNTVRNISFAEKVRIFSHDYLKCCLYISSFNTSYAFTKKLYLKLISTSQLLEDFLDFHGAKNNKDWYFYRELTAAVRHLSLGSYSNQHISNRLQFYNLSDIKDFKKQGESTFNFLTGSLMKMAPIILDEARHLNILVPEKGYDAIYFPAVSTSERLDSDIDDENKDQEKENIVKIASEFLSIAIDFDHFGFYEFYDLKELLAIVPAKINEVEIRRFEMLVHNLQSSFDTYVILHGGHSFSDRKLKELRSFFSIVFHLLQMTGRLLHFYERHLFDAGYKNIYRKVQDRLISIINPEILLHCSINYGLYYVYHFLTTGKKVAQEILNENIERSFVVVGVPVKLGFHCRPSLLVAKIVQHYGGRVELCVGTDKFDASSVLDIQWAGGKIQKENITKVTFKGDVRALKDIKILSCINYGEDTMGKGISLPDKLKYLR